MTEVQFYYVRNLSTSNIPLRRAKGHKKANERIILRRREQAVFKASELDVAHMERLRKGGLVAYGEQKEMAKNEKTEK